jgi:hypothetical protein
MARVDPHLTFGCEVCLDTDAGNIRELTDVQHEFIGRLVGVHDHSILAPLFTETGILPLTYCRPFLALGYLIYLIDLAPTHLAKVAYLDSLSLAASGMPCWFSDLRIVLASLPIPVALPLGPLTSEVIAELRKGVITACQQHYLNSTKELASRLPLIQGRLERNEDGNFVETSLKLQQYLRVPVPAHRKALTRLYVSCHTLGIEVLRYKERYRKRTPQEWRLCCFCGRDVETAGGMLT